eukprot:TRINITY_DN29685_c0_g1_i1.p1 TRINITY_DN29685_c0_g1~~TRINITY_DN29685_c0_g1_i1.p1  ORF type:complete len:434 (-),score=67.50 TRINITY_DN29685_c0_g1_i1:162-1463(-)
MDGGGSDAEGVSCEESEPQRRLARQRPRAAPLSDSSPLSELSLGSSSPSPHKLTKQESASLRRRETAQGLVSKGVAAWQLVQFWQARSEARQITRGTKTLEVVRNIVIPETARAGPGGRSCCYMDVMLGGPKRPRKMVSHSWQTPFKDLVLSIVRDASGLSIADAELVLSGHKSLNRKARGKTYWICIFAVDQHNSICGMCNCGSEDYCYNPCKSCGQKKRNPCTCGSEKFSSGSDMCQIDKFDLVMREIPDGLMVALDAKLQTLKRAWVIAEIGEALFANKPICYYGPLCLSRSRDIDTKVDVEKCDASDPRDKDDILYAISHKVGFAEFNARVSQELVRGLCIAQMSPVKESRSNRPSASDLQWLRRQSEEELQCATTPEACHAQHDDSDWICNPYQPAPTEVINDNGACKAAAVAAGAHSTLCWAESLGA